MQTPFYVRLYVDLESHPEVLLQQLAGFVDGDVKRRTVAAKGLEVDVSRNDEFSPDRLRSDKRDFLYYPLSFDIEATGGTPLDEFLAEVGRIMNWLASLGASVVASCDWEELLPGHGKVGAPFPVSGLGVLSRK